MSCFKFPKGFVNDLNMIIAKFWWGGGKEKKGIHWLRWNLLCVSKLDRGLGFRDFESFNLALLAKQGWRLMQEEKTLCHKVLKAKYFPNADFLQAEIGNNPSFLWRSLLEGKTVLETGSIWRVGNGRKIQIFDSRWLRKVHNGRPSRQVGRNSSLNKVEELIALEDRVWNEELIRESFSPTVADEIMDIPLSKRMTEDRLIWEQDKLGRFTVRSAYSLARIMLGREEMRMEFRSPLWKIVWTANIMPKVKYFI